MITVSGKWLAVMDWIIALVALVAGFIGSGGCLLAGLVVSGVFTWLGVRAWRSADHW